MTLCIFGEILRYYGKIMNNESISIDFLEFSKTPLPSTPYSVDTQHAMDILA